MGGPGEGLGAWPESEARVEVEVTDGVGGLGRRGRVVFVLGIGFG